ncbi:unnamed protein product [Ostreobium quekettii]|uniref:Novel STAND NTPase 1 domain-containing protein n=1 Tax=Ostreobium quekettii TaxID=121088 RepID=A0A8S1J321_9CHLO|nr:unnamed protein product [Ostreobium quekettii]|eukprot:evm.model.scf_1767.3 EVM.evm.TU.scf_1767.3   scf_1767:17064-29088(-)
MRMGGFCSCFGRPTLPELLEPSPRGVDDDLPTTGRMSSAASEHSSRLSEYAVAQVGAQTPCAPVAETELLDVVVAEDGELVRTKKLVAKGAASNLAALIVEAHDLAKRAVHSMQTCFTLVHRLCTLQQCIWLDRRLMADAVVMLEVQEIAMEVIHMNKLFSNRGWLARLNSPDADDKVEFMRLSDAITALQERCSADQLVGMTQRDLRAAEWGPSSGQLMWHLRQVGGLHMMVHKGRHELREFVSRLAPLLSVRSSAVADLVDQEIKIASASELPGPHCAIRHPDVRLLWYIYLRQEEVPWALFWNHFPESLLLDCTTSEIVGSPQYITELLKSDKSKSQFQKAIQRVGARQYITTVEVDHAFPPNKTIEECVRRILDMSSEVAYIMPRRGTPTTDMWATATSVTGTGMSKTKGKSDVTEDTFDEHIGQRMEEVREDMIIPEFKGYIGDLSGIPGEGCQMVGREEEINKLCALLEEGRRLVAIVGMCGIGKSAVAVAAVDQLLQYRFWKNAHYVNLARVETVEDAAARIACSLAVPLFQSSVTSVQRLTNWLKREGPEQPRCGWLLDGVDTLIMHSGTRASFFSLLMQAMRHTPHLQLVVTCRSFPDIVEPNRVEELLHLDELSPENAMNLAEGILGGGISRGEAHYLVNACGGVPLAIKIAGGCVVAGVCSAVDFMESMREPTHDSDLSAVGSPLGPRARVQSAIKAGISALDADERQSLMLLSECPAEFSVENVGAVLEKAQKPTHVWALLWRLMMRGFLRFIPADGTYQLEGAVYETVQRPLSETTGQDGRLLVRSPHEDDQIDREAARAALLRYYITLLDRVMSVHVTTAQLSAMRLLEQERGGLELFVLWLVTETVVFRAIPRGSANQIVILASSLCEMLVELGIHFFSASQRATLLDAVFNLTERTRTHQNRIQWCDARLGLARALIANCQGSEAEHVLDNLKQVLGEATVGDEEKHVLGEVLVLKGKIRHLGGRFREAEHYYMEGLKAQKEVLGEESFPVSRTLSQLGPVQQGLRRFAEAENSYKTSLKIRKKHQDRNVVEVTIVMHNLASLNHLMRRHDESLKQYQKSLKLREKYLGHVNVEVASSLGSLAAVKVSMGQLEEAEGLYRRAIAILKEILGEDHMAVAEMSTKLAVLLESHGEQEEASMLYVDALEVKERTLGSFNDQVLKLVGRVMRVMAKTAGEAVTNTAAVATESVTAWSEYLGQAVKGPQSSDGLLSQDGLTTKQWESLAQTASAADLFVTARSLSAAVGESPQSRGSMNDAVKAILSSYKSSSNGTELASGAVTDRENSNTRPQHPSRLRTKSTPQHPPPQEQTPHGQAKESQHELPALRLSPPPLAEGKATAVLDLDKDLHHQGLLTNCNAGGLSPSSSTSISIPPSSVALSLMSPSRYNRETGQQMQAETRDPENPGPGEPAAGKPSPRGSDGSSSPQPNPPLEMPLIDIVPCREDGEAEKGLTTEKSQVPEGRADFFAKELSMKLGEVAQVLSARTTDGRKGFDATVGYSTPTKSGATSVCTDKRSGRGAGAVPLAKGDARDKRPIDEALAGKFYDNSAFLTMTVEQDLMESTNLAPEHIDALQSIVNPLYRMEVDAVTPDSEAMPAALVTTHASFDL